jgi:uncharacterized protein YggT (Ycf19 family)
MNYVLAKLIGFALDAIMLTVHRAADLFLGPIRRFIPAIGGLDISPIIALVILNIVRGAVASLLL